MDNYGTHKTPETKAWLATWSPGSGFLGAGAIIKEGMNVRGLNTAATLWASAAVGACAGADMVAHSAAVTVFVLAGNTLLPPLVNAIDRIPLNEEASEASYHVIVTSNAERAARCGLI
jgi:putative Mg2+ transporter-C (MgtC) family protein